jgi:hypothetical protein
MKITNADVIKSGEKDLIDSITADLDWGAIENIFLTEHNLGIDEDIEYKKGDIIACNNQVAYKLEFTVKVNLSVLINRDGEYLSVKISEKQELRTTGESSGNKSVSPDSDIEDVSGDNSEKQDIHSDQSGREDRYYQALEQIGTNDSENAGDTVRDAGL